MKDGDKFEKIRVTGLVEEESNYDPASDRYDVTLQLSAKPPEEWANIYQGRLDQGAPDGLPAQSLIRGDTVVVRGTPLGRFEGTLLRFLKDSCKRTNDDYAQKRARQATNAEAEQARRAEMEAKREKGQRAITELAERLKTEAEDDE